MTQLKLVKGLLASRGIRDKVGNVKGKLRTLNLKNEIVRPQSKNVLEKIGDFFNGMQGFITGALPFLNFLGQGFSGALSWIRDRWNQIRAFNWAASDRELESLIQAGNQRIFSVWGTTIGTALGWTTSIAIGAGISMVLPVIGGAALAKSVAAKAAIEGSQEIASSFGAAIAGTAGALTNNALISAYINIRKAINGGKATQGSNVDMSFSARWERVIEGIQDKNLRSFVDSASDAFEDGFWEGGMIVAYELDSAYAQAKRAQEASKGKKRTVRLIPDKKRKDEMLILSGNQVDVEQSVIETLNNYRLIANRDVGQIVGMPAEDFVSAKPLRRQLTLVFKSKKEPPYKMPDGKPAKQVTITIPDVVVGLTWRKIKEVALKFTWGKFRATAHLDNGRQMAVYGATKTEAERTCKRLATLSTAKILALNVTEEVDKKNINLRKQATTMYPAHATLLVRRPTTGEGKNLSDGSKVAEDRVRVDLWTTTPPAGTNTLK